MNMLSQKEFWNREARNFDAIYSHRKSRFAVWLDRVFRRSMYLRFERTIQLSEPIESRTFLDVGCGTGLYSLELARRGAARVTGIDVSGKMIRICRSRASKEGLDERTNFVQTDIADFHPLQPFDISIGMGLMDYIKAPLPALVRLKECTSDRTFLSFPVLYSWRTLPRIIRLGLKRCPVYFYTGKEIRRLISRAGFRRCRIERMGPMYFVTAWAGK